MSSQRILLLYRLTFVSVIILASVQTIVRSGTQPHHALVLAALELTGALALGWRRSQLLGAGLLLVVFAFAQVVSAALGDWSTRFLLYAASTLVIVLLDTRLSPSGEPAGDPVS